MEEIGDQRVEPFRLIPLYPVSALIEQMKLRVADELKEQKASLHRNAAVLGAP